MPLNKQKGNMYDFVTHTWNPLGGNCTHACTYCSTNKFFYEHLIKKYSGPPCLMEEELKVSLGKNNFIFVVAQNDLFAEDIPDEWIRKILKRCEMFENKYLFQTKNPFRFWDYIDACVISDKSVLCTTIETNRHYPEIMKNAPKPEDRVKAMYEISDVIETYITMEPIMDFDLAPVVDFIWMCKPLQVNIGADSGNNHLPEPGKEKILRLIEELEKFTKVKQKTNLKRLLK